VFFISNVHVRLLHYCKCIIYCDGNHIHDVFLKELWWTNKWMCEWMNYHHHHHHLQPVPVTNLGHYQASLWMAVQVWVTLSHLSAIASLEVHIWITFSASGWCFKFSESMCFCCFRHAVSLPWTVVKVAGICRDKLFWGSPDQPHNISHIYNYAYSHNFVTACRKQSCGTDYIDLTDSRILLWDLFYRCWILTLIPEGELVS
jgi:hypothetical protein